MTGAALLPRYYLCRPTTSAERAVLIESHLTPCDPLVRLRQEREAFDALREGDECLCLWQPQAALLATAAEARQANFAVAIARAAERGFTVQVRPSGGGAVCVGPGTLVAAHLYTTRQHDIGASYQHFAGCVARAVADFGVSLMIEAVAGAYCDGRFDLAHGGRKVGGIAQRRSSRQGIMHVWVHAIIYVDAESLRYPPEVERFYADLRSSRVADPRNARSLADCLAPGVPARRLLERCAVSIAREFAAAAAVTSGRPHPPTFA